MDFAEDLADYLSTQLDLGERGTDIRTVADYNLAGEPRGILIENTAAGSEPDITTGMDEALVDITVCLGYGQIGRDRTARKAFQIYRALACVHDVQVGDTLYRCISAATPPYELWQENERGVRLFYQILRVSMTRYYEGVDTYAED